MSDALPNLLPPLSLDEREALRASMQEHGFWPTHPVITDEEGNVLDGHHRKEVAEELGLDYPTVVAAGLSRWEKVALAIKSNIVRRQLDGDQRRRVVRTLEQEYDTELDRLARAAQVANLKRGTASPSVRTQTNGDQRAVRTQAATATATDGFNPEANAETYARHAEKSETADKNKAYAGMLGTSRSTVAKDRALNRFEDEARAAGVEEELIQRALDAIAARRIGLLTARTQLGLIAGVEPNRNAYVNPTYGSTELASLFTICRGINRIVPALTQDHINALAKSDIDLTKLFINLRALENKVVQAKKGQAEHGDTND